MRTGDSALSTEIALETGLESSLGIDPDLVIVLDLVSLGAETALLDTVVVLVVGRLLLYERYSLCMGTRLSFTSVVTVLTGTLRIVVVRLGIVLIVLVTIGVL